MSKQTSKANDINHKEISNKKIFEFKKKDIFKDRYVFKVIIKLVYLLVKVLFCILSVHSVFGKDFLIRDETKKTKNDNILRNKNPLLRTYSVLQSTA